jgi:HlyD family secretion protein
MDISIQPERKSYLRRYWFLIPLTAIVIAVVALTGSLGSASYVADRANIVFGDVKRGEFSVQVRGTGTLVPKNIQWLAANVDGRVDMLTLEAGAVVAKGDVIATLSNPKLHEQLEEAKWEMEAQTKEFRAAEAALQSQLVDLRVAARNAELDYDSAKLKLDAEQSLVERGIVSRLSFEQSKLATEQHRERISSARERVQMMEANLDAQIEAHAARLNKIRNSLNLVQQQIDDLTIKARIDGVLQEVVLKLGQQVVQGAEVARIAPHDNLVAMLEVQEYQVRYISLGLAVTVDTRSSKIPGKVVRIDPAVTNGVIKVEVALEGEMPPEARPDLSIEGTIDVERKDDALYVNRPSYVQSDSKAKIYVLDEDGDFATQSEVTLGRASTRHIEVLAGLQPGDRIIISDSSAWEDHKRIRIR